MNKLKNSIFKILIELFIFDKVKRSKIKARWAKRYLKKYLDVQVKEQLSRRPLALPTMKINPAVRDINDFRYEDFELTDYQCYDAIKAQVAV